MTDGDALSPGGMEPALGGQHAPQISGMEPELGGSRRVKPDPRLVGLLLGSEDERQAAIEHILDRGLARLYALELVKIVSTREIRQLRTRRRVHPYTTEQRIAATRALESFGQAVAVEALAEALGDRAWWVGQYAIDALIAIGPPAVDEVIAALEHREPIVRRRAADVLGFIGDRRATGALTKAVADDFAWVRMRAVEALGRLRDPAASRALQDALHDPDALVARAAVEALRQLGAGATAPN
jgi:hypothetical protein